MKACIFLVDGFEDVEAIMVIDILRRASIDIDLISLNKTLEVTSAHQVIVKADILLHQYEQAAYTTLILPGGAGYKNYIKFDQLKRIMIEAKTQAKLIAAICAAPSYLAEIGILSNVKATSYPDVYDVLLNHNVILSTASVVKQANFITAKSLASSLDFALCIVETLKGEEAVQLIKEAIYY
ncbi:MAG: DJ-1 family glyoxalase III [Bacilli bacterium]